MRKSAGSSVLIFTVFPVHGPETPRCSAHFSRGGRYEELEFPHDLPLDLDAFIGRNLSASYAPLRGSEQYPLFIEALVELFRTYEREGRC